jgi:hypothetical protein
MARTNTGTSRTRHGARTAQAVGCVVYVLDAWEDTHQRSVVAVFSTRPKATRALARVLASPGDWYAGIVTRRIR